MRRWLAISALAATALAPLAGCGGEEERVSREEFSDRLKRADKEVSAQFEDVFRRLGRRGDRERVPDEVKDAVRKAADVEREALDEIEEGEPPEQAEEPTERLVEIARRQADRLERAAEDEDLTVRELVDAFERESPEEPVEELRRRGFLERRGE